MRQIAATHRGDKSLRRCDKSPHLHCCYDKSLQQVAATSRCDKTLVRYTQTNLKEGKCELVSKFNMAEIIDAPSLVDLNFVAATCRRSVHTLRQGCSRLFCRCDMSAYFVATTDRSDKILSQRQ